MCVKHTTEIILTQPNQTPRHGPINTASCGHHKISISVKISNLKISLITKNKTRGFSSVELYLTRVRIEPSSVTS